ncbi:MAG: amidohydrolase family protein [Bacteroidota bacterium]|nr:amidohydrolase family protein [Bacteroidota bacterium]
MIDAHVHFWKYNKTRDAWITDDMKIIQRDFLPADLQPIISENNVDGVIAVQADQSENETNFLLSVANDNNFIKGIVGWVDLQNENIENRLLYYSQFPIIKGFRHIVQAEPAGFLKNKKFLNGVQVLKKYDFTYDVLIYETQLKEAVEFVNYFPAQKFIIDHGAKPSIRNKSITEWKKWMTEISKRKNIFCKLSGLITEAKLNQWEEKNLYPYLDVIFESFGIERIVFGSDWPVMLLSGNYKKWKELLENYMAGFSSEEKEKVFTQNAIDFYNLNF